MNYTLENFIDFCDEFQIAEEGINIKNSAHTLLEYLKQIWGKIMKFVGMVKTFVKKKLGKDRAKPKDEIVRLQKELDELKRSSSDKIDSLHGQRSYLVNQRNNLQSQNANMQQTIDEQNTEIKNKDEKIAVLEKELKSMRSASNFMDYLDADIHKFIEIHRGDIKYGLRKIHDMKKKVSDVERDPNGDHDIKDTEFYGENFDEDLQKQLLEELDETFARYKDSIKDVRYSARGRFQNYFIYQNIELITSRIDTISKYNDEMERIIEKIDRLPDTCKYKTSLCNEARNISTHWITQVQQCKMLINKLTDLTNGSINDVY